MHSAELTVVYGKRGFGRDGIPVSVLSNALHFALISLLPHRLYPKQRASVEVRNEISRVCVSQLLSILLPGEVR